MDAEVLAEKFWECWKAGWPEPTEPDGTPIPLPWSGLPDEAKAIWRDMADIAISSLQHQG